MLQLTEVAHGSEDYARTVALRDAVLRRPLGLAFSAEELAAENESHHLVALDGAELVACLVLKPLDAARIQMRQVAVSPSWQRHGIGRRLVRFAEDRARALGYREMVVHAREAAAEFYTRLGYDRSGEPFREVGLVHFVVHKVLRESPAS
jgi:predicted N-acetyltransferase YhbS